MKFLNKFLLLILVCSGKLICQEPELNPEFDLDINKKATTLSPELIESAKNLDPAAFETALGKNQLSETHKLTLKSSLVTEYIKLIKQWDLISTTNNNYSARELSERKKLDLSILGSIAGFAVAGVVSNKYVKTITALCSLCVLCSANYQLHLLDKPHIEKEEKDKKDRALVQQKMKKIIQMLDTLEAHPAK